MLCATSPATVGDSANPNKKQAASPFDDAARVVGGCLTQFSRTTCSFLLGFFISSSDSFCSFADSAAVFAVVFAARWG
jgi:hypothetical protein